MFAAQLMRSGSPARSDSRLRGQLGVVRVSAFRRSRSAARASDALRQARSAGNATTSSMCRAPVAIMTARSKPSATPEQRGQPCAERGEKRLVRRAAREAVRARCAASLAKRARLLGSRRRARRIRSPARSSPRRPRSGPQPVLDPRQRGLRRGEGVQERDPVGRETRAPRRATRPRSQQRVALTRERGGHVRAARRQCRGQLVYRAVDRVDAQAGFERGPDRSGGGWPRGSRAPRTCG